MSKLAQNNSCILRKPPNLSKTMKLQAITTCLLAGTGFAAGLSAAPAFSLGEGADVFLTGSATAQFNDNIYYDSTNEVDDLIFIVSPGIELVVGQDPTAGNMSLSYQHQFYFYQDNSEQDDDNGVFSFDASYDGAKISLSAYATYRETDQNFRDANLPGVLISREIITAGVGGEYILSPKTSFGVGLDYSQTDWELAGLNDNETWSVPVDFFYKMTPKVDASVGYRYRTVENDFSNDYDTHFFNVGLRGELTPKTYASIRVGYEDRSFDNLDNDNGILSFSGNLTWNPNPKSSYGLSLVREFSSGALNTSEDTRFTVDGTYALNSMWSIFGSASYEISDYDNGRSDDFYSFQFGAAYSPNTYLSFSAAYIYYENDSNSTVLDADYQANLFNLTASVRY